MAQAIRSNLAKWAQNIGLTVTDLPNKDTATEAMDIQGKVVLWRPSENSEDTVIFLESAPNVTYTDERETFVSTWVLPIELKKTPIPITLRWIDTLTDTPQISIKLMGWTIHLLEVAKSTDHNLLAHARALTTLSGEELESFGLVFWDRALELCEDFSRQINFVEIETPWYDSLDPKPPFGLLKLDVINKWREYKGEPPIVIPD